MAQPQPQASEPAPQHAAAAAAAHSKESAPSTTVKVRIKTGRLLVGRVPAKFNAQGQQIEESQAERYAEEGEVVEVERKWAEKLTGRQFDGYPSKFANGAPGMDPGIIRDCPIEIIN